MNLIDKIVSYFNPRIGVQRSQARVQILAYDSQIRRYEAAALGRRHSGWLSKSNPSVNQVINRDLNNLVQRSRELAQNNSYAKKAPTTIANNVVGTGITLTPILRKRTPTQKLIPLKGKALTTNSDIIKNAWNEWADKTTCDFDENYNFYGIQHLAIRTIMLSGEVLIVKKSVITEINKFGLQLQILEGDYIDKNISSSKNEDGGYTTCGIKFSKQNKKLGYYLFDRHPSESNAKSKYIPCSEIIHVFDVERAGQTRGVPAATPSLLKQKDLDDYEDAELLGKKTAACMPIFVQNTTPESETTNDPVEAIEPGAINYLNPGETVTFATPPSNNGFESFVKTQHRAIAAGYYLTYEQFTGDLSNVNFSSGRMGWQEFNRMVEFWQYNMIIPKLCDKVFTWFEQRVRIVEGIPAEIEVSASWTAPRRAMIDPAGEIKAMKEEVRAGFTSWTEIVKSNGYNPDEIISQLQADQIKFEEAGLMSEWNPKFSTKNNTQS